MKKSWILTRENLTEVNEEIGKVLENTNAEAKEIWFSNLLLEEVSVELFEVEKDNSIQVVVKKKFGNIYLEVSQSGQEYNPLDLMNEWDSEDVEKDARHNILCANRKNLSFQRKNGKNCVIIQVHEFGQKLIMLTLMMSVLGLLCGVLLRNVCPDSVVQVVDDNLFSLIKNIFMNALKMMIAPVVFFSITSSISGLTNLSDVGKTAGKMVATYTITTMVASVVGIILGALVFREKVPMVMSGSEGMQAETATFSFRTLIEGLVPQDLVSPIQNGDMIQIVVVAMIVGLALSILSEKIKLIQNFFQEANTLCMQIISMIMKFIPLVTFASLASMAATMGMDSFMTAMKFFGGLLLGVGCMMMLYALILLVAGKISPLPFLKKVIPFMLTPFSTASSSACIPSSLELCEKKLGIATGVASFTIPIGATINMDGGGIYLGIMAIMYARMFDVGITTGMIIHILFLIVILTIGTPGMPGSNLVCISMVLTSMGIPMEATAFLIGINVLTDMIVTANNVAGDIAVTTMIAASEGMIDRDVYYR